MQNVIAELVLSLIAAVIGATTPASDPDKTWIMCDQAPAAQHCSPRYTDQDDDA